MLKVELDLWVESSRVSVRVPETTPFRCDFTTSLSNGTIFIASYARVVNKV